MINPRADQTTQLSMAALFAVWLVFCQPWFIDKLIIPHDAKNHFYAMVRFAANAFHNGESPFWSPYHFAGFPMLADPQSTLLTPSLWLPTLLSSTPSAHLVDAVQLFHLFIIGAAVFAFGRARGWVATAALAAALTIMMGGALTIRLEHVLMNISMMWLCVALWRLDAALRYGGWWRGVLFGLPLGLMLLDRDHVAYLGAWFLLAFWLAEIIPQFTSPQLTGKNTSQTIIKQWPVVLGGLVALAMTAIPVVLLLQLAQNSNRPEFDLEMASWQSLHPATLVSFFWPEFLGSLRIFGDYWGPASSKWGGEPLGMHRGMMHLYLGVLPVVLLFWYGILGRRLMVPNVRFFLAIALFMLVYSLGRYTPFFAYLYDYIPGVNLFRRPSDGLFIFGLAVSLMSGALLDDVLSKPVRKSTKPSEVLFVTTIGVILYLSVVMAVEREKLSYFLNSFGIFIVFACLIIGLLFYARRIPKMQPFLLTAFLLIVSFDLIRHASGINGNARPIDFYKAQTAPFEEPVFAKLQQYLVSKDPSGAPWRIEILGLGPAVQNIAQVAGFHNLLGYNPIRLKTFDDHLAPIMQNSAANKRGFGDVMTGYDTPITNQLGIKYIVTGAPIENIDPNTPKGRFTLLEIIQYGQFKAHIYENIQAEPRAIVINRQSGGIFKPAKIIEYENTKIRISVESPEGGQLVLRDFDYPGWIAQVNGEEVPIYRHEGLFRAVSLPPGQSSVTFKFQPLRISNLSSAVSDLLAKP